MTYKLEATDGKERVVLSLSDNSQAVTVTLSGDLCFTSATRHVTFTLARDRIQYEGFGLDNLHVAHLGQPILDIHRRLADHFHFDSHGLENFRLSVDRQYLVLTSPKALSDGDCKAIFEAVMRQFRFATASSAA